MPRFIAAFTFAALLPTAAFSASLAEQLTAAQIIAAKFNKADPGDQSPETRWMDWRANGRL